MPEKLILNNQKHYTKVLEKIPLSDYLAILKRTIHEVNNIGDNLVNL